jgi:hypothetical protein
VAAAGEVADLRGHVRGEAVPPAAAAVVQLVTGQVGLAEPQHRPRRGRVECRARFGVPAVLVPHEQRVVVRG